MDPRYPSPKSREPVREVRMNLCASLETAIVIVLVAFRVIMSFFIHKLPFSRVYFFDNTLLQQLKERMPA